MRSQHHSMELTKISLDSSTHVVFPKSPRRLSKLLMTGLPCHHAISCMKEKRLDNDAFMPDCYKKESYGACYILVLYLVSGQTMWTRT